MDELSLDTSPAQDGHALKVKVHQLNHEHINFVLDGVHLG